MEQPSVVGRERHFCFADLMTEASWCTKVITLVAMVACVSLTLTGCGHATVVDHFPKDEQGQSQDQEAKKQKEEKKP